MNTYNLANEVQLRNYNQIAIDVDAEYGIVWVNLTPMPRPCFNPAVVQELRSLQIMLEVNSGRLPYKGEMVQINYLVLDSEMPGIFSMGGDLDLFRRCIINKNKKGLLVYAKSCIDTIHGFITGCRQPITTIALVRGDALGGDRGGRAAAPRAVRPVSRLLRRPPRRRWRCRRGTCRFGRGCRRSWANRRGRDLVRSIAAR